MRRNLTVLKKSNVYFQLINGYLKAPCKQTQHCWPTTPNIVGCHMLRPFAHHCQQGRNNSQNCWSNIAGNCCILLNTTANKDATTHYIVGPTLLGIVASYWTPLPTRTQQLPKLLVQHCWELLHPFEHHCQQGRNNSQNCWSNIAGNCCILLNTTGNKDATTHNIVGSCCVLLHVA